MLSGQTISNIKFVCSKLLVFGISRTPGFVLSSKTHLGGTGRGREKMGPKQFRIPVYGSPACLWARGGERRRLQ